MYLLSSVVIISNKKVEIAVRFLHTHIMHAYVMMSATYIRCVSTMSMNKKQKLNFLYLTIRPVNSHIYAHTHGKNI